MIPTTIYDSNFITDITHSPLFPLVLLTVYLFGTGFTIGNYVGYFRFNKPVYGDDFVRAYLAFTIVGAGAYFLIAAVAWLWAAKYVSSIDSRIRKVTVGVIAIFLLHDLPIFSMELHAILNHGWRNGYQGFVFVAQLLQFLLSFTCGWLYFTWVTAGWCQYWYGNAHETYTLKTGSERLDILPPLSPYEREGEPVLRTPMLGSGLRWAGSQAPSQPSAMRGDGGDGGAAVSMPLSAQRRLSQSQQRVVSPTYSNSSRGGGGGGMGVAVNGGIFFGGQHQQQQSAHATYSSQQRAQQQQQQMRPVNIGELEQEYFEDGAPSRGGGGGGGAFNGNNGNAHYDGGMGNPPSLQQSSQSASPVHSYSGGRGVPRAFEQDRVIVTREQLPVTTIGRSPNSWRNLPAVNGGGIGPVMWADRKSIL